MLTKLTRFWQWPLAIQMFLGIWLSMMIVGIIAGELYRVGETDFLRENFYRQSKQTFSMLRAVSIEAMITEDIPVLETIVAQVVESTPGIYALSLYNEDGHELAAWKSGVVYEEVEKKILSFDEDIVSEGEVFGRISLAWDTAPQYRKINDHVRKGRNGLFVTLFFLAALIALFAHFIAIRPINRIDRRVVAMTRGHIKGELSLRVAARELLNLARSVNRLSEALKVRDEKEAELVLQRREIEQANTALRASEENLQITLDSIGDAVIAADAQGRITRMNPVAAALTGWEFDQAKARPLGDVFNTVDADTGRPVPNSADKVMRTGESAPLATHTVLLAKDGTERRIADDSAPIRSADGEIVGVVLVFRDVTEQHRLAMELRQSEKMQALGQLAGGIAHDFNNMLAGILGASELIEKYVGGNVRAKKYIDIIGGTAKRAAELTGKLLTFSSKGSRLSGPLDMHGVIREAVSLLERSIDKRIRLVLELEAVETYVIGDSAQLENAILNLGVNARDAMPEGGALIVTTDNPVLDEEYCRTVSADISPGQYIRVSVRDTGTGIPAGLLDRIFEPFFTTKAIGKGTGLGLSAVYGTVMDHRGDIAVYSEQDEGTVFHIYLPVTAEAARHDKPVTEPLIHGTGLIMVVDDEEAIRTTVTHFLEEFGYDVLPAADGVEALEVYKADMDRIDLVILDMVMPRMNGRDTFFAIRALNPNARVILASGFVDTVRAAEMEAKGLLGIIKKPYFRAELSRIVSEALKYPAPSLR